MTKTFETLEEIRKELEIENKNVDEMTREELYEYYKYLHNTLEDDEDYCRCESDYFNGYTDWDEAIELLESRFGDFCGLTSREEFRIERQLDNCGDEIVKRTKRIAEHTDLSDYVSPSYNEYGYNHDLWAFSEWNYYTIDHCWENFRKNKFRTNYVRFLFIDECCEIIKLYGN